MKKTTLLTALALSASSLSFSQIFSDNFESYSPGYLGPQSTDWTTWSNADGTTEDVNITTANSQSGLQAIYFSSTATTGGPQDVILKLDQVYSSGIFTFQTGMMVPTGKVAHFNFQKTAVPGAAWTLNVTADNGSIVIDDAITADLAIGSFTPGTWFNIKIEANLTLGVWEAFINGASIGTWSNGTNQVAAVDFYPQSNLAQFYIDDVSFDHTTYTLPNLNATASSINLNGDIATQTAVPAGKIVNGGQTAITSFTATLNYNGTNDVVNVTGVNIASLANNTFDFNPTTVLSGANVVTMTISNVNGGVDDDNGDDVVSYTANAVTPAAGKVVVGEEGTGTWCGYCPRGTVFMDRFENKYDGFWAGIAVHNNDPMTVTEYDAGMGAQISGYPSALVDRGSEVDPSGMTPDFLSRLQTAPAATLTNGATWDASSRTLSVSVRANFLGAQSGQYKMACVLTEDHVTGTASGYNQSNYYSYQSNNADLIDDNGLNWKTLTNPVPAAQMEYNHVARAINGTFTGTVGCIPSAIIAGEEVILNFEFILPADWDEDNIHIIGMLFSPNGRIDNGSTTSIATAVSNGLEVGCSTASVNELLPGIPSFELMPNPATSEVYLVFNDIEASTAEVEVIDMAGKVMIAKSVSLVNGNNATQLNTSELQKGMYVVKVVNGNKQSVRRLIIQ